MLARLDDDVKTINSIQNTAEKIQTVAEKLLFNRVLA